MQLVSISLPLWMAISYSLVICLCIGYVSAQQRQFIDDAGMTHTTTIENPTIICSARMALALHQQFKINAAQIVATYGNFFPRGSLIDVDDPNYQPFWPVDPTKDELAFLGMIPTLSASCFEDSSKKCTDIDIDQAKAATADKWIYIDNGSWHSGEPMQVITDSMGNAPIFINTHSEATPGCTTYNPDKASYEFNLEMCTARSLLDVIKRTNELAQFLGIAMVDIAKDQRDMCDAARLMTIAAEAAHLRGIRVMTINPSFSENNAVTLYPVDPLDDPYLRSYEELGVPILHPGKHPSAKMLSVGIPEQIPSRDWFIDCLPGQMFSDCNNNTYYPVDLWLIEGSRFMYNTPEEREYLNSYFPDKALLQNQVVHWPLNDGPISYTTATRTFNEMTRKLNMAIRIYEPTTCSAVDVTSKSFLNRDYGGLSNGQYACYNYGTLQTDYITCMKEDLGDGVLINSAGWAPTPEFTAMISKPGAAPTASSNTLWKPTELKARDKEKSNVDVIDETGAYVLLTTVIVLIVGGIIVCVVACYFWEIPTDDTIFTVECKDASVEDEAIRDAVVT